jgi:hypothetical protein
MHRRGKEGREKVRRRKNGIRKRKRKGREGGRKLTQIQSDDRPKPCQKVEREEVAGAVHTAQCRMDKVVQYSFIVVVELARQARAPKCMGMGKLSGGGIDSERSVAGAEGSSKTRDAALEEERWGARGTGGRTSGE